MPPRSSTTDGRLRSAFRSRPRQGPPAGSAAAEPGEVKVSRIIERPRPAHTLESELDHATYNCGCGFVFEAAVLTSVACPHCGDSQAW